MPSAWVFATVSETVTVLGNRSDIEMTMALAAQLPTAAGNQSYYPFSVTAATLATSAVPSWVMAQGTSAALSWAMVR